MNLRNLRTVPLLLICGCAYGAALADLRWGDSPTFVVNVRPIVNGLGWANSNTTSLDLTLVSRAFANSNSFSVDSPAPPPDQPAQGQNVPTVTIDLDRLREWDPIAGRFIDPAGPIEIDPTQLTYLLTHGWDDTLNAHDIGGCDPDTQAYGMSTIAAAIHAADPNANVLGWEWGTCILGSNPDCLSDVEGFFANLPDEEPTLLLLRALLTVADAWTAGANAKWHGGALARKLKTVLNDPNVPALGSAVHFIGHSHGGGLLARAAEQLHDAGHEIDTLTMLDTPRWGVVDTMDLLSDPSKIGHVAILYGENMFDGAFGEPYDGEPNNVTSIRLNPDHVEHWLHLGVRGDDYVGACGTPYGSWFADAITSGVQLFLDPDATVLDPRTLPAWRLHEGTAARQLWPVGACNSTTYPPTCTETDQEACMLGGGVFQGGGTHCTTIYERARDGTPPRPENDGLRLLSHNGMESAADWQGTNVVVAAGSDPANPANVLVRIVDVGDASFFRTLAWPTDAYAMSFDYMFDTQAVSETLTVYIGDQIVYYDAADISLARGGLRSSGPIAVRDFAGQTATLNFVLRSDSVPGGMCLIDNLRLLALPAGDVDFNGVIDQADAIKFMAVMNGPDIPTPPAGGSPDDFDGADFEEDYDVDLRDLALMQAALR